jgi:hypothetical protein
MKSKNAKVPAAPEHSIKLRCANAAMIVIAIVAACLFGNSPTPILEVHYYHAAEAVLFVWLAVCGCLLSYNWREKNSTALNVLKYTAVILVMLNFARELISANIYAKQFHFHEPLIHALTATAVVNTYELKSRNDINVSAAFGLVLLVLAASSGKSLLFGFAVLLYVLVGSLFLTFECEARALAKQPSVPSAPHWLARKHLAALALLPLVTLAVFFVAPRADALADSFSAWARFEINKTINSFTHATTVETEAIKSPNPDQRRSQALKKAKEKGKAKANKVAVKSAVSTKVKVHGGPPTAGGKGTKATEKPPKPGTKAPSTKTTGRNQTPLQNRTKPTGLPQQKPQVPPKVETASPASGGKSSDRLDINSPSAQGDALLFRVAGNRTPYIKEACFDTFDGEMWRRSDQSGALELTAFGGGQYDLMNTAPMAKPRALSVSELTQNYYIEAPLGKTIPAAGIPQKLFFPGSKVIVDAYGNLSTTKALVPGTRYVLETEIPVFSLSELRNAQIEESDPGEPMQKNLQIPTNQSSETAKLAASVAGSEGNRFQECERIAKFIKTECHYVLETGRESTGGNQVDNFLKSRQGDCKEFASTFVILAREVGVPARLVAGYLPGDLNKLTGATEVRSKHAHVWAEAYMPPFGWVPFDCTPMGSLPGKTDEVSFNVQGITQQIIRESNQSFNSAVAEQARHSLEYAELALKIAAGVFAAVVGLFVLRQLFLDIRSRQAKAKLHPAAKLLLKVVRALERLGVKRQIADTPQDLLARLERAIAERQQKGLPVKDTLLPEVKAFLDSYEACRFNNETARLSELQQRSGTIQKSVK